MPLELPSAPVESRRQMISFDPERPDEAAEAQRKVQGFLSRGFTLAKESDAGCVILDPPSRDPHKGFFSALTDKGDEIVVWDRRSPDEVRDAYKKFHEFLTKKYTAYAVKSDGTKGHQIEDFDPGLEEIMLVPPTMPG